MSDQHYGSKTTGKHVFFVSGPDEDGVAKFKEAMKEHEQVIITLVEKPVLESIVREAKRMGLPLEEVTLDQDRTAFVINPAGERPASAEVESFEERLLAMAEEQKRKEEQS